MHYPRRLIVMALELEGQGVFERRGIPVLYCGVGKVNATYALTRRLADYRHAGHALPHVVNFGTAGSRRHPDRHASSSATHSSNVTWT